MKPTTYFRTYKWKSRCGNKTQPIKFNIKPFQYTNNSQFDARVGKGRKSVYGIATKLQITVFALMSQTDEKKLYSKILLKNIENDNNNFEKGAIELE